MKNFKVNFGTNGDLRTFETVCKMRKVVFETVDEKTAIISCSTEQFESFKDQGWFRA